MLECRTGGNQKRETHCDTLREVVSVCRPLCAAVAAAGRGRFTLDGVPRMRERPIQDLVDGLRQLGVDAECTLGTGCPPVTINARGLPTGTVRPSRGRRLGHCVAGVPSCHFHRCCSQQKRCW